MAIGIDPKVDFAFKLVLGSPDHPNITLHFLNAVLSGDPVIREVTILNPFIEKDFAEDKVSILDIRARDDHGQWLNIEMQTSLPGELRNRLAYYVSAQYVCQLGEGEGYRHLTPSVGICVLDGMMFPEVSDLNLDFRLRTRPPVVELTNALQIHLLELPKYRLPSDNVQITDPIEQWAYFFRQAAKLTPQQLSDRLGDSVFAEAAGVLEMIARNPKERELYEARLKMQRDEQSRLEAAEARGRLVGRVQLLQELLGRRESEVEDLASESMEQLAAMARDLQRQLRERG